MTYITEYYQENKYKWRNYRTNRRLKETKHDSILKTEYRRRIRLLELIHDGYIKARNIPEEEIFTKNDYNYIKRTNG